MQYSQHLPGDILYMEKASSNLSFYYNYTHSVSHSLKHRHRLINTVILIYSIMWSNQARHVIRDGRTMLIIKAAAAE